MSGTKVIDRRAAGLCYIPEDRYREGLASRQASATTLPSGATQASPVRGAGCWTSRASHVAANASSGRSASRRRDLDAPVRTLSGGNAQRVVVARELADPHALTIASQPTRGIDIAATQFVRSALLDRRATGSGVLLISSDLEEILTMSDRIVVLYGGRIAGELRAEDADEIRIGLLMAGTTTTADAMSGIAGASR